MGGGIRDVDIRHRDALLHRRSERAAEGVRGGCRRVLALSLHDPEGDVVAEEAAVGAGVRGADVAIDAVGMEASRTFLEKAKEQVLNVL